MKFDIMRILENKRIMRRRLASLPVAEKLAMLDALRGRELEIRDAAKAHGTATVREPRAEYPDDSEKK